MHRACRWLLPATALVLAACGGDGASAPSPEQARVESADAASADGMCPEHGVLETVCTKCNPALIAVFQGQGDWCAEHGYPESFCPICSPEAGGRPVADVSGPPPSPEDAIDGTRIRFKSDRTADLAGIETERAQVSVDSGGVLVPGTVVADAGRVARVNARASGVLKEVLADVGRTVGKGDGLAVIASSEAGGSRSHVQAAEARVRAARAEHEREKALREERISSEKDLVAAKRALDEAEAELAGARAELGVLGAVGPGGTYTLRAPLEGVVIERSASVGQLVHPDDALFTLVDPKQLWIELDVPERHLALVKAGSTIDVESIDGRRVEATIDHVSPVIEPATRTAKARAKLAGAERAFHINARIRARVRGDVAQARVVTVSADAIQRIGEHDVVFVRRAADDFELKRVEVSWRRDGVATLAAGVEPGAEIATTGSFLLKTEVLKASIGSGCCEVE